MFIVYFTLFELSLITCAKHYSCLDDCLGLRLHSLASFLIGTSHVL